MVLVNIPQAGAASGSPTIHHEKNPVGNGALDIPQMHKPLASL